MLNINDHAPKFTLPANNDTDFSLSDQNPKNVVLYFYPKDDTPGCTKEAIGFTALIEEFGAADTVVVGISKDTIAKHQKFINKHSLDIILVSDAEGSVCEQYGTWVEKKMYGKTYMGIERTTFLIKKDGTIAEIWNKVKVPGHPEAVLEAVQAL